MSVAAVLERQPNVRDVVEVPVVRSKPWELADVDTNANTALMQSGGMEVDAILFPEWTYSPNNEGFEKSVREMNTEWGVIGTEYQVFADFLERYSDKRYQYGNFTSGISEERVLLIAGEMESDVRDQMVFRDNFDHVGVLIFAYGMKINIKEIDVQRLLNRYFSTFGTSALEYFEGNLK